MNVEEFKKVLGEKMPMVRNIGMELVSTDEPEECVARMLVNERNHQPYGYLSGGAMLAMAETLAGVGSHVLCPDAACMGMSISASHVHGAAEGDLVTATARLMHRGRTTHVWQVSLRNQDMHLISIISVTNHIVAKPS